jgi:benzoyl-CoA reductase/2-hydroxyglutaryl-CoA dehydratase subunit BcrC/BadD/HgdB
MEKFTEFKNIVTDPYTYCHKYKEETGKKIVGYTCSYTPEEIIYAAGALPFRLFGTNEGIHRADIHLQTYCCSLIRGVLEEGLSGRLDFLDGVVFPHTCDTIQRLSDIWRLNIPKQFHIDLVLPVKLNTASARQYLIDILERFKKDLEHALGAKITDAALADAIKIYNQIRTLNDENIHSPCPKAGNDKWTRSPQHHQSGHDYGPAALFEDTNANRSSIGKRTCR